MNRKAQLMLILLAAILIASAGSHALIAWFGIQSRPVEHRWLSASEKRPVALALGSSLMGDAFEWNKVSEALGHSVETWFVPGSSPCEWEPQQDHSKTDGLTIVCISAYDMNEEFLCDFRSEVTPLSTTVRDLRDSGSDWHFAKRVLSQYPLKYFRILFPTIGRSQGIMVGFRAQFARLLKPRASHETETVPKAPQGLASTGESKSEKINEWSEGHMLRRVAALRVACQGRQGFNGPKKLALFRMLSEAQKQGRVLLVVLPVSSTYRREFLTPELSQQFEALVGAAQASSPKVQVVRLDKSPQLGHDEQFWDLVHMNSLGQEVATRQLVQSCGERLLTQRDDSSIHAAGLPVRRTP